MSYEKQNFTDGSILMAEHLNKIEDQIALNEESIAALNNLGVASETWVTQQIQAAINSTWEASY